ncbi:hypothetical protein U3450_003886 [Bacillus cytotoxicus]|uniref:hypothetical protein n=1 Tax=unclassified Bacillus cereus group TaxID=2750818 RepID=UPI001F56AC7F|nr:MULTISPECIES: hypothetical protein [unclassified Bacillus cereus group]EMA6344830.1 hypothetical protein [Bacillus cytotoxicus]
MKKFNVAEIMQNAWVAAANAAFLHGGKKSEYFAECLKAEWAFAKQLKNAALNGNKKAQRVEKTTNEIIEIKSWFVRKNFSRDEAYVIETNDWIEVLEETAKAYKLRVHNAKFGGITTWAPKSCCVA